jgi:alpha-1,3-rhamnosyltransferase
MRKWRGRGRTHVSPESAQPLVTVVIPSYNYERFVTEAIDSVLSQDYDNLELIVIDDGSTDGSARRIGEHLRYRTPATRVEFWSRPNRGRSATLNEALGLAHGTFVTFLDADDVLEQHMVRTLVAAHLAAEGAGAAFGDGWVIDERGHRRGRLSETAPYRGGDVFKDLAALRFFPFMQSSLIRTDVLEKVGSFDDRLLHLDDWDMWLRLTRQHEILYIDKPVFRYRIHGNNRSIRDLDRFHSEARTVVQALLSREPELASRARALHAELTARHAASHYNGLNMRRARTYAVSALRQSSSNRLAWKILARSMIGGRVVGRIRRWRRRRREHSYES